MEAAPSASTPTTRQSGSRDLRALATPLISPPPPTATTKVSASGAWPASSRPTVAWPAMTAGSSKGEIQRAPVCSACWRAACWASS
jgi:hypothetical protein